MSVEQIDVIDFISIDSKNRVALTISDHLLWDEKDEHLLILQSKINAYLEFIDSGQLLQKYPKAKDRSILINIIAKYEPNLDGHIFLNKVKRFLEGEGHDFIFEVGTNNDW